MIKKFFVIIYIIFFVVNGVYAKEAFEDGLKKTGAGSGHTELTEINKGPENVIGLVIQTVLSFLGVIFLGLMIYAGYIWMMARGNEQDVDKAKKILQNAIIGLVVVMAAYVITAFMGEFLSQDLPPIQQPQAP